jgi:hypothetical protein
MTVPPDFGGLEIEEGLEEDLGAPASEHRERTHLDRDRLGADDNEAHAPGQVCGLCGSVIAAGQDVRRRADGSWVHEVCPPDLPQAGAHGERAAGGSERAAGGSEQAAGGSEHGTDDAEQATGHSE